MTSIQNWLQSSGIVQSSGVFLFIYIPTCAYIFNFFLDGGMESYIIQN